ncbi:MAG: ABC transporter substrate-binding protein [Leptolyngbyaceae cyanobacterium CSU_1_3]|nr:ABC transporter substrate-binding protein [Leptolyngbyaceae cyanobacterium CSU_1_3]
MAQIAPTVVDDFAAAAWKENFLSLARIFDRTEQAQQQLEAYKQRIAELRQALGDRTNLKVSLVRLFDHEVRLYSSSSLSGSVLQDVGLKQPLAQASIPKGLPTISISLEELEQADGDIMFLFGETRGSEEILTQLQAQPLWQLLNVVKQGQVYLVSESHWFTPGIQGVNRLVDDLFQYLVNNPEIESS